MKFIKQHLVLAAGACLLFSCTGKGLSPTGETTHGTEQSSDTPTSKQLSRKEAADAISQHFSFPNVEVIAVMYGRGVKQTQTGTWLMDRPSDVFEIIEWRDPYPFNQLKRKGVLSPLGKQLEVPAHGCKKKINPSSFCVAAHVWELKEVTGIAYEEATNTALVDYVVITKGVNTFGYYAGKSEGQEETRRATLKRFDDGSWRVQDAKPEVIVRQDEIPYYASEQGFDEAPQEAS